MNKTLLYMVCFLIPTFLFGQSEFSLSLYKTDTSNVKVGLFSEGYYNSAGITNDLVYALGYGREITSEIKDHSLNKMGDVNHLGGDVNYGIQFSKRLDSFFGKPRNGVNMFIGLYNREHADSRYSKDIYQLIFYGNKPFAGNTLNIEDVNFNAIQYQQFQIGFSSSSENGHQFAFGVSYLNGEKSDVYNLNHFALFTSEIGDEIETSWDAEQRQSNQNNKGFAKDNGWGLSSDIMYQFSSIKEGKVRSFVRLEINDLGFINWYDKSTIMTSSDSINYVGYQSEDLFSLNDSLIAGLAPDSIVNNYSSIQKTGYKSYTPTTISTLVRLGNHKNMFTDIGANYRFYANYRLPYFFIKENFRLSKAITLGTRLNYGGYSNLSFGMDLRTQLNGVNIALGTNNLDGLILKEKLGGLSAFLTLTSQF